MTSTDLEALARGLTKAGKAGLLMFADTELLFVEPGDEATVEELFKQCLVAKVFAGGIEFISEQPLGLALRTYLQEQGADT